jgi:6-phosphogluconolactonase
MRLIVSLIVLAAAAGTTTQAAAADGAWLVYFGTYTTGSSRGIYVASFDAATGRLGAPRLAAETPSPSFLALHPSRPLLYAVNEVNEFEGEKAGTVSAFAIDPASGDLKPISRASSRGTGPCHLAVDRSGRNVLVANYGGGSVASLPLRPDGGVAASTAFVQHKGGSVDPRRQTAPHAHMVETDPKNKFALVADLGLDQMLVYKVDAKRGLLQAATPAHAKVEPGSGPRHFAFSPDGRDVYVLNEMLITIMGFRYKSGGLTSFQTVEAMPGGAKPGAGDSGAEIMVHPSGRFVYASLRGPDSIAVFSREAATGKLALVEHVPSGGRTPRAFAIDPSGRYLLAANQRSDQVAVFAIDLSTGRLKSTGQTIDVGAPVSVAFFRARR